MHAPAAHAHDDLLVRHVDLQHVVDRHAGLLHRLGLRDGAREAVEQVARLAVGLPQALLHHLDDQLVRYQVPGVHHLLRLFAERAAGLDLGAQHVAGRNLRDAEPLADELGLRALARARRPEEYQPHEIILRTASRS